MLSQIFPPLLPDPGLGGSPPNSAISQMKIRDRSADQSLHTGTHVHTHSHPPPLSTHKISWEFTSIELKKIKLWLSPTIILVSENLCVLVGPELVGDPGGGPARPRLTTALTLTYTGQV